MTLFGLMLILVSSPLVAVLAYGTYVSIFEERELVAAEAKPMASNQVVAKT